MNAILDVDTFQLKIYNIYLLLKDYVRKKDKLTMKNTQKNIILNLRCQNI